MFFFKFFPIIKDKNGKKADDNSSEKMPAFYCEEVDEVYKMEKNMILHNARKIGVKPFLIFVLVLLFLIPLFMVQDLVGDRNRYHTTAIDSILEPKGGEPVIEGFAIALPHTKTKIVEKDSFKYYENETFYVIASPETWNAETNVKTQYLTRGIFKVPVFQTDIVSKCVFSPFDLKEFNINENDANFDKCILMLGIANKKNLTRAPDVFINGKKLKSLSSTVESASPFSHAVFYRIPAPLSKNGFTLDATVHIQGGAALHFVPFAESTSISISSPWKTPAFKGSWLPTERSVSKEGFSAHYEIAGLSTIFPKMWNSENQTVKQNGTDPVYNRNEYRSGLKTNTAQSFFVEFLTSVDNYQKTERSIKYAILFLIIPFLALFIFEIFSGEKIHPVQYCLIGLADVIFYVLLLSLSEHLGFGLSYFISATAVCILGFFYATAIFKGIKWGALFLLVHTISYLFLLGTLQAEDFALLIGSIGLFFIIALLMALTHRVNWYGEN